jgi:hypothetical protein
MQDLQILTQPKLYTIIDLNLLEVIQAPTGSGKSTLLTRQFYEQYGGLKTASIQPRIANCFFLYNYMKKQYNNIGIQTGSVKNQTFELDYCTTGAVNKFIETGEYDQVIFDEIQDITLEGLYLLFLSVLNRKIVKLMSATIPSWVYNIVGEENINKIEPPIVKKTKVREHTKISFNDFVYGSNNVTQDNILMNMLKKGNVVIFVPTQLDAKKIIDENFKIFKGSILNKMAKENNLKTWNIFRGTEDSKDFMKLIDSNDFPKSHQIIFAGISLGTGVTIPNLKAIYDFGLILKIQSEFTYNLTTKKFVYRYNKSEKVNLTEFDLIQRKNRGGRVCNSDYFIAPIDLQPKIEYPFENDQKELVEILAYIDYDKRILFYEFLKTYGLISPENTVLQILEDFIGREKIEKQFIGFDIFQNIKTKNSDKISLHKEIVKTIFQETQKKPNITKSLIIEMINGEIELSQILDIQYCPVDNRIKQLIEDAQLVLSKKD